LAAQLYQIVFFVASRALLLGLLLCPFFSIAGELNRADIAKQFAAPLVVGEQDPVLKLWPVFKPSPEGKLVGSQLHAYAFEAVDVSPVPGYSGKVINMLITLDTKGNFVDVKLLSHQEPIFVGPVGNELMERFADQYRGLSVSQNIRILNDSARGSNANKTAPTGTAQIQGISRGTVTAAMMDKSIMQSALKVASGKLGIIASSDPSRIAKLRFELFEPSTWQQLTESGLIKQHSISQAQIEKPFVGTPVAQAAQDNQLGIELSVALLSLPQVGKNLLDEAGYKKVTENLSRGVYSLLIVSRGPNTFIGDDFILAGGLNRVSLKQKDANFELKDFIFDHAIRLPADWDRKNARVVLVSGYSALDPSRSLDFQYRIKRSYGSFGPRVYEAQYAFDYTLPVKYWEAAPEPEPAWVNVWRDQQTNVFILMVGLVVLSIALTKQHWLVAKPKRLQWFRLGFLVFTLVFVGWYGQGQLSVVTLTGVIDALRAGNGLAFLMFDPMSFTLWVFVAISLVVWGRGTFCGWLCPFGAMQELVSVIVKATGFKGWRLHTRTDAKLKWIKYAALLGLLLTSFVAPTLTSTAAEIEPFKTAVSLHFVRAWPFVAWAVISLLVSVLVYRGYCRYICPLGAALAIAGKLRLFSWIPRRNECGTPCQTCRHRCEYQAIEPKGKVDYAECFQCLDCVEIHDSDQLCAPLITEKRRQRRVIEIAPQS
jgi:NosR/NirI family transcriptional regulator, nitrous oxide reductase regulator